jgi:para-nitrobenzyl esterase
MMQETARFTVQRFTQNHQPAYLYRFGYLPAVDKPGAVLAPSGNTLPPRDNIKFGATTGAYHGYEIAMVFDNPILRYGANASAQDRAVAKMMSGYWVAFAKTGDPNGAGRPLWAPYSPTTGQLLVIDENGEAGMKPDPWKARLDVVETLNLKTAE